MRALTLGFLLSAITSTANAAASLGPDELNELSHRVTEDKGTPDLDYSHATDVRSIKKDWAENPARALIKYNKVGSYLGVLRGTAVRNDSDGDLILEDGSKMGVTVLLFKYQFAPWKKKTDGSWGPEGAVTSLDFAAMYEKGQKFYLECKQAKPDFLIDCLAVPAEATHSQK
ncbi:hypothetical protein [Pseudomonas aeruginosa]|uniref:hypothetical protein n=1 Tax=Pseudomonas aeruginosa TaxID=287 RepID=UPI00101190F2|nr:hypothetical protein [Pseudomonas aeruginosa]HBO5286245.1 hypothetical protein [Pseudomonas aeruginosa]HBO6089311.1 hypothetical protein [Pseudomonas aeruginosa]